MTTASFLEKFPSELKQEILSALPDVVSLRSAALSCPPFYHALIDAERLITTRVLKNQFKVDVLPEAIAALKSSQSQPWTRQRVCDFVDEHLQCRMAPPDSWTLSEALRLSTLYCCVQYFTGKFVGEMFNASSAFAYIDAPPAWWPLSPNETNRVQRAFYRFEIYCNLFRGSQRFDVREQRDLFFFKFSHWENEQLACLHDYLFRAMCPGMNALGPRQDLALKSIAFNDIESHTGSVFSEVDLVEYGDSFSSIQIQDLLSHGLERLQQIANAGSYEARYHALHGPRRARLASGRDSLYKSLRNANKSDDELYLSDYTQKDNEKLARYHAPFVKDPDTGPMDAWRWAHQDETRANFVYSHSQIALRARGYCMWDLARLEEWHVFQQPWKAPEYPFHGDEQTSRRAEMDMWCERRGPDLHAKGKRAGNRGG